MNLFERIVELRVGDTEITGLDIAFEIEKDESPEPNPCHVEIFNLSAEYRSILSKYQRVPVLLKAGYKDSVGVIFNGDMLRCSHIKEGPTWKTILASGDGVLAIQTKRINKTFSKGTPVKTVIQDLAKQMGLSSNSAFNQLDEMNRLLSKPYMVSGNPMAEVTRLLSGQGIKASVQNKTLQIRRVKEPLQKEALSLNSGSGLIASPEMGARGEMTVRSLLMPDLLPGRKIHIESSLFNGFAAVKVVRFFGATFGDAWETEMECIAN
jgi:hypothetical protein